MRAARRILEIASSCGAFEQVISECDGAVITACVLCYTLFTDSSVDAALKLEGFCGGNGHFDVKRM